MNNKILTLEQIKNMSHDDLLIAFRDGYRLSEYPEYVGQNWSLSQFNCTTLTVVVPTTTTTTTTTTPGPTTTTTTTPGPTTTTTTTPGPTTTTTTTPGPTTTTTTTPIPGTGSITFVTTSLATPLSGVAISVDGTPKGMTDSLGNLRVINLTIGTTPHTYVATKTGYNTVSSSVVLSTTTMSVPINMTSTTPPAAGMETGVIIIAVAAAAILAFAMRKKSGGK